MTTLQPLVFYLRDAEIPFRVLSDTERSVYQGVFHQVIHRGKQGSITSIQEEDSDAFLQEHLALYNTPVVLFIGSVFFGVWLEKASDFLRIQKEHPVYDWILMEPSLYFIFHGDLIERCIFVPQRPIMLPLPVDAVSYKAEFLLNIKDLAVYHHLVVDDSPSAVLPDSFALSLAQRSLRLVLMGKMHEILQFVSRLKDNDTLDLQAYCSLSLALLPDTGKHRGEVQVNRWFLTAAAAKESKLQVA
ncbi:MAG TPA: hypothetical protein VK970_22920 [Candidatus Methylacidiphilales bacterium]|nr:hypothetical protein [Candidatus Methylacidiphilales bacterium]